MVVLALALCGLSVEGTVRAAPGAAPVAYAQIAALDGSAEAQSDSVGRYRLMCLATRSHALRVSRLGYETRTVDVAGASGDTLHLDIELSPQPVVLPPIDVVQRPSAPDGGSGSETRASDAQTFATDELSRSPLVDESDPLLSLPTPDALTTGDPLPGLHIHSGAADQNVFLLDGVPIYNPYHTGGISALSADAVSHV